ncbi:protein SIEVE ELEMENT OCCLUSION B-like [Diospyros lotus]|uniref:protein SIEVE ELEMENT OCCLUSION B-like n=1 Tax=Diospyros lotus TaxID=55363 RepID=UPI00225B6E4C|nr:protein SIEVE ELEMENT OCCLUSION B-like [Diospyros lotus]
MAASNGVDANGDEALMMKRILATHKHLDVNKFDPNPLLHAINDVIQHAKGIPVEGNASGPEGHLRYNLQHLPYEAIKSVSCEFSCKHSGASTTSEVAIRVFQSLGNYSWEAKAVITLAAFAANYGSYVSISKLYGNNDLFSKSTAFLQLSPYLLKQTPLKLQPEALKVVEAILDLAKYIIEIKSFQSQYVQHKMFASIFAVHENDLAKAVYMSIQTTVACASILMNTVALGNEYTPSPVEAEELLNFEMQLKVIHSTLISEMKSWKEYIG